MSAAVAGAVRSPLGVPVPASIMSMSLADAAVAWAEAGWSVFPIVPRGKTPYATGEFCGRDDDHSCGFHCATRDSGAVAGWWRTHPDSNIGIAHAEAVVIDEDRIGALAEAGITLPRCPWAVTGRAGGGRHFFLRPPTDWPGLGGEAVKVTYRVPAVEVKGFDKGYVVAAPSIHASGSRYELRMGGYVPEVPGPVLARLTEVERVAPAGDQVITIAHGGYAMPERIANRYGSIRDYTAHLYNRRLTVDEMWPLVLSQLAPRFVEPLAEREIRDRFNRAVKELGKRLGEPRGDAPDTRAPVGPLEDAALTEFDSAPVEWLWPSWLPRGVVTVMDGNPGVSKSTLVADLVSRVTRGRDWPDGSPGTGEPARAMWITTEDDPGRVLRPRIEAAGGDPSLVRFVTGEVVFPSGASAFQELVVRRASEPLGLDLVILDPLYSHIDASVKTIADAEMRKGVMNPLSAAAEAAGVAVLVVRHFSKDATATAINRGAGSLGGIVGAARCLWTVVLDPEDEAGETKVVGVSKLNYARIRPAWRYRVGDRVPPGWVTGSVPVIEWVGEAPTSIDGVLASGADAPDARRTLEELLSSGPMAAKTVADRMRSQGFGRTATRSAKTALGVVLKKDSMAGGWRWHLQPAEASEPDQSGRERDSSKNRPDSSGERDAGEGSGLGRDSLNDSSDPSNSSKSHRDRRPPGARPRASAREEPVLRVVHDDDDHVACHFYSDHQTKHKRGQFGAWYCPICSPEEEA